MQFDQALGSYIMLLKKWNKSINLVQEKTIDVAFNRHVADSLQISDFLEKNEKIIDIGSGAGFPGMVLALNGFSNITLCEKSFKKSIFLTLVKNKLGVNVKISNINIYNVLEKGYTCISRAFGSVLQLLDIMYRLESPKGILHKGENYFQELSEAKKSFNFDYQITNSTTNKQSVILIIRNIRRI
ncbi:MAG: 16S rRNA (guanine(527)-N(7))-methyltransferase RsmG [Holosporales bacterium]|jgi:16S rRNA (guanine527-N7)-methyltransferase|nr:16S rRNA (guanine(527)-N(7))-methyltransferase RsmG [Holosporales bacterium]